ncbi:S26 family signal peptidase (plasmid) [Methylomonas sp. MED-D]|uniref:S26 family signal peptidase n=1 Tax=Methylomonas sp. MED-D TaxID=3418768 RepID=UPI003D086492
MSTTRPLDQKAFWLKRALPALLAILIGGAYLEDRFRVGIDDQKDQCLPGNHRWFLIDTYDKAIERDHLVAFVADQRMAMAPWFSFTHVVIKIATGVPGDTVRVGVKDTRVNDTVVSEGLALSAKLGKSASVFIRTEFVADGDLWVTGTTPNSFDSRYWGLVHPDQLIGKVYALPF